MAVASSLSKTLQKPTFFKKSASRSTATFSVSPLNFCGATTLCLLGEISDNAYDLLTAYNYPGNVRELENIIEHAFVRTTGNVITQSKLPIYLRQANPLHPAPTPDTDPELEESRRLRQVLTRCHWNRRKAAEQLGMSRTTLWRRMKELDLLEEM